MHLFYYQNFLDTYVTAVTDNTETKVKPAEAKPQGTDEVVVAEVNVVVGVAPP